MSEGQPWKTVLIEDQALFRTLLVRLLREDFRFDLAGESPLGEEGWQLCLAKKPRLVLLDLHLPDIDGLTIGRRLLQELPETRVLAVTTRTDAFTVNQVIETGLHGYIEKDEDLDTLEDAMVKVAKGETFFSRLVGETRKSQQRDSEAFVKILSDREQEVLRLVVEGKSSKAISGMLGLSPRTVENHRFRIMQKLDLHDLPSLTRYAIRVGLIGEP